MKGDKCYSRKCPVERRAYPPGQHGQGMQRKLSDYGIQLREKQKMRRIYGVREGQFRNYMTEAVRRPGVTGDILLQLLEMRLDNVVYRLGLAASRAQARQFVSHGHIQVNGKRVNIASYQVRPNDVIEVAEGAQQDRAAGGGCRGSQRHVPLGFSSTRTSSRARSCRRRLRDEIDTDVQESLIVEYYSR